MKKAFALMLTLVLALSICANPDVGPKKGTALKTDSFVKPLTLKSAKSIASKTQQLSQIQNATSLNNNNEKAFKTTPTSKIAYHAATEQTIKKAPRKADGETVELNCTGTFTFIHFEATDECPSGNWYFGAVDETKSYVVRLYYAKSEDEKYGTFTLANLDANYSFLADYTSDEGIQYYQYLEGTTFTVSKQDGLDVVEGTLVCDNGVTYNFHAKYVPETVDIEGTDFLTASYSKTDNDWYLEFQNDNYRVTLDLISPDGTFDGTYTENEALLSRCYVTNINNSGIEKLETLTVTMKLLEGQTNPLKGSEITGTAIGINGDTFNFHMMKNPPIVPKDTLDIDIDLTLAEWPTTRSNCKSYFRFTEKASQAKWNFALNALRGELTEDDLTGYLTARIDPVTYDFIEVDHGKVNVTLDPETLILNVVADLVMKDSIDYRFSFNHQVESQGDVAYNFTNLTLDDSYWGWFGIQWFKASNDDVSFELTVSDEVPCEYNDKTAYARLYYPNEDGTLTEIDGLTIFNAKSSLDEDSNPILECKFLADDMKMYTIMAHFEIPEIQDTINVAFNNLTVTDLIDDMGVFQIAGYNDDSSMYVTLAPETTKFPGHYTMDNLTTYASYSYLITINPDGTYTKNEFYQADFDVTQDDRIINITGQFQAGSHWVNMTLQGKIPIDGLDYDVEDEDIDVSFGQEDLSELVKYEKQGYAYVRLQNAERNDCFAMLIYLKKFDDVTMFPEGTYEINGTYGVNTVQQGSIKDDLSTVYPTFYATCADNGNLRLPLWLFRSGTATIMKDVNGQLAFEINAMNSYERTCHITYNLDNTGIKNVDVENYARVRKMIDNRQIVIKKGDRMFTVAGQEIK